jgi:hypothetical protein
MSPTPASEVSVLCGALALSVSWAEATPESAPNAKRAAPLNSACLRSSNVSIMFFPPLAAYRPPDFSRGSAGFDLIPLVSLQYG